MINKKAQPSKAVCECACKRFSYGMIEENQGIDRIQTPVIPTAVRDRNAVIRHRRAELL